MYMDVGVLYEDLTYREYVMSQLFHTCSFCKYKNIFKAVNFSSEQKVLIFLWKNGSRLYLNMKSQAPYFWF